MVFWEISRVGKKREAAPVKHAEEFFDGSIEVAAKGPKRATGAAFVPTC